MTKRREQAFASIELVVAGCLYIEVLPKVDPAGHSADQGQQQTGGLACIAKETDAPVTGHPRVTIKGEFATGIFNNAANESAVFERVTIKCDGLVLKNSHLVIHDSLRIGRHEFSNAANSESMA